MTSNPLDQTIRQRKTRKILAAEPTDNPVSAAVIDELIEAMAGAPFHYPAASEHRERLEDCAPEPWRAYTLDQDDCLALRRHLVENGDMSKVPDMLAAAGALVMVTWCPNPPGEGVTLSAEHRFAPTDTNMEHIAATAAAIQNLLLAATARNLASYWSSGGPLRHPDMFSDLGIPESEILLGAVFLSPREQGEQPEVQVIPGKMRDKKSSARSWARPIQLPG